MRNKYIPSVWHPFLNREYPKVIVVVCSTSTVIICFTNKKSRHKHCILKSSTMCINSITIHVLYSNMYVSR